MKVKSLSRVLLLATPRTVAHLAPPSMGFSRQEYWSGMPLPSPQQISTEHLISALDILLSSEVTAMNKVLSCQELTHISFPGGSDGKEPAYNVGDPGSVPGLGRSLREGNGNLLCYSCLENPMDRGTWQVTVHGVAKS